MAGWLAGWLAAFAVFLFVLVFSLSQVLLCVHLEMLVAATETLIGSNSLFVYPAGLKSAECFLCYHTFNLLENTYCSSGIDALLLGHVVFLPC